jgi:hypothetical protein
MVQSQPGQNSSQDPISKKKKKITKKVLVEWLEVIGPEFKPQYQKKKIHSLKHLILSCYH